MTRRLTAETLVYDLTWAYDSHLSPDGERIAYTVAETDRTSHQASTQLWLRGVDGAAPRRLTWSGRHNGGARWSPDGRSLAFVSDRVETNGIFLLSLDGGEPRELTHHRQPIGALAWSADGAALAYVALFDPDNPDETERPADAPPRVRATRRIDYKQDNRGYLADLRPQVWLVEVASGARRMLTHEPIDHNQPQWSPDGRAIAVQITERNDISSQLGLIDVATGAMRRVGPPDGIVGCWSWSPTGDRILIAGEATKSWQLDLFVYDVAADTLRLVTDDLPWQPDAGDPTLSAPSQPVWLDERRALVHGFHAGASGLYVVDVETGAWTLLHEGQALNGTLNVDAGRRFAVQPHTSLEAAGELVVVDLQTGEARIVTTCNEALLREAPPATWERFDVRRSDVTIEAWLLKPPGFDPSRRYPLVIDVHGGPNGWYGYTFSYVQQLLASHGFLVVFANPRGSGSYGRHFVQQVTRDWGGEDYLDLMAVVDGVLERPYADPDRTGIFGYSYGGYMTAWTISRTARFQAAVCGAPVFDLTSFYGTSDIGHNWGPLQFGGKPHEERDWYLAHSPSTFAHQTRTPTLILHGEADDRCPIGQGEEMFVALREAGCEVEFVRYPGASHLFLWGGEPTHVEDFLRRTLEWFQRHLMAEGG